jgi:hypothetical protein
MKMSKWRQLAARAAMIGAVLVSCSAAAASSVPSFKDAPKLEGDRDFCLDQVDGVYEHPDCRVHYQCSRHLAAEVKCPEGEVFDLSKNPDGDSGKSACVAPEAASHVDCSGLALHK